VGKGTSEDQDYGRLGKGGTFPKYLQINHPTNASTETHIRIRPIEPTTDARVV
jgi:hypothetical protein